MSKWDCLAKNTTFLLAASSIEKYNYIEMDFIFHTTNNDEMSLFWYENRNGSFYLHYSKRKKW